MNHIQLTQKIMDDNFGLFKKWFTDNGIIFNIDDDGDLHFKYQMCDFYILDSKDDQQFLEVMLPHIWQIDNEEELFKANSIANKLNRQRKALKVFTTDTNTILTVEMVLDKTPDVDDFMERILDILIQGRLSFAEEMRALQ